MMLLWVMNLDFAASASASSGPTPGMDRQQGAFLVIGAGCYLVPLLAVLVAGVR